MWPCNMHAIVHVPVSIFCRLLYFTHANLLTQKSILFIRKNITMSRDKNTHSFWFKKILFVCLFVCAGHPWTPERRWDCDRRRRLRVRAGEERLRESRTLDSWSRSWTPRSRWLSPFYILKSKRALYTPKRKVCSPAQALINTYALASCSWMEKPCALGGRGHMRDAV